jgi:hypothetical protein
VKLRNQSKGLLRWLPTLLGVRGGGTHGTVKLKIIQT